MSTPRNFHRGWGRLPRVRGFLTVCLMLAAVGLIWATTASQAAGPCPIPGGFEIDGNMNQNTCTPSGNDWDTPNIGVQATDQGGTYQTSSKDDADPTGWTSSGATPDKTDFAQEYATSRVTGGHFFVYVAWERTSTTGTQGYAIEIDSAGSRVAADGTPQPDRSKGGVVFYLSSQGSAAPAYDGECKFTSQATYGSTCDTSTANFTAAINTVDITDPFTNATQVAGSFFEVGLDVTGLTGITPSCPGASADSVYLRSITGQTSNGNLKGYMKPLEVAPDSTCVPPPIDTTATPGGSLNPPGATQSDMVTVGTALKPGVGTVKFFLCSPSQVTTNGGDCSANGTQAGAVKTLDANGQATSDNVTGATTPNDNATGTYCWRAEFTPSANDHNYLAGSHTNKTTECFTVVHGTPTIGTQIAVTGTNAPSLGFTTLGDSAQLSGFVGSVTGETITFRLYGPFAGAVPSTCTADSPKFTTTGTLNASGQATTSATYQPTAAGTYIWIASYPGDTLNDKVDGKCTDANESVTILAPSLSVTKLAGNGQHTQTVNAGDPVEFTITVANAGPGTAKNVSLDDPLPPGTAANWVIKSQTNLGQCAITGALGSQTLDCTGVDLGSGESYSIDITSSTDQADCTVYDNTATASSDNAGSPSDEATITCLTPNLSVTKLAGNGTHNQTVNAGDPVEFTIQVANEGPGTAKNVSLDDPLPAGTAAKWVIKSQTNAGQCAITGALGSQTLHCNGVDLAADDSYSVDITSSTDQADCTVYDNTATASSDNAGSPSDDATITCLPANVSIAKTADHSAPVNAGDQIGFTVEVENTGAGDATGVTLSDPLPAGSGTGVTWSIDGSVGTPAQFVLSGATGSQTLSLASGTVPADSDYTVHITAQTSQTECSVYDNTATLTTANAGNPNPASAEESCAFRVDLAITKSGSPTTQDLGQGNITWTMVVTNNGPDTDTGVKISDPMPAGNTFVSASSTQGTCTGGAILNCEIGTMAAGAQVTITLVTTPSTTGIQTNTATVSGDKPETNLANNVAMASVEITQPFTPPCVLIKRITPGQLVVGRKTVVKIYLSRKGQSVKGIKVRIKGAGINVKTTGASSKGVIKHTLKMKRKGILVFSPLATPSCGAERLGVRGPFTPPVTG
jgi:uncharacterized repeat protein (TIGR01451 family)